MAPGNRASLTNLPREVQNQISPLLPTDRLAAAFRSQSTRLRDWPRDQAFLDRLSKLLSFIHLRRGTFYEDGSTLCVAVQTMEQDEGSQIYPNADGTFSVANNRRVGREQVLQMYAILSTRVTALQVRLLNFNNDFDELILDFPAPLFVMREIACLT